MLKFCFSLCLVICFNRGGGDFRGCDFVHIKSHYYTHSDRIVGTCRKFGGLKN